MSPPWYLPIMLKMIKEKTLAQEKQSVIDYADLEKQFQEINHYFITTLSLTEKLSSKNSEPALTELPLNIILHLLDAFKKRLDKTPAAVINVEKIRGIFIACMISATKMTDDKEIADYLIPYAGIINPDFKPDYLVPLVKNTIELSYQQQDIQQQIEDALEEQHPYTYYQEKKNNYLMLIRQRYRTENIDAIWENYFQTHREKIEAECEQSRLEIQHKISHLRNKQDAIQSKLQKNHLELKPIYQYVLSLKTLERVHLQQMNYSLQLSPTETLLQLISGYGGKKALTILLEKLQQKEVMEKQELQHATINALNMLVDSSNNKENRSALANKINR